jgi:hypothetical protein
MAKQEVAELVCDAEAQRADVRDAIRDHDHRTRSVSNELRVGAVEPHRNQLDAEPDAERLDRDVLGCDDAETIKLRALARLRSTRCA